jgi:hypothetical protein
MSKTTSMTLKAARKEAAKTSAPAPEATQAVPQVSTQATQAVALRGGGLVRCVTIAARPYRVGAPQNAQRWALLQAAAAAHPQGHITLAPLLTACLPGSAAHNYMGPGVPGHFVSYALRKGYLLAV